MSKFKIGDQVIVPHSKYGIANWTNTFEAGIPQDYIIHGDVTLHPSNEEGIGTIVYECYPNYIVSIKTMYSLSKDRVKMKHINVQLPWHESKLTLHKATADLKTGKKSKNLFNIDDL